MSGVSPGTSGRHAQQQRVALAAPAAERGSAEPAAPALQLIRQCNSEAGARSTDRMAESDRATVDVDLLRVDAEHPRRVNGDRRERLVDLDQVEVAGVEPGSAQRLVDR